MLLQSSPSKFMITSRYLSKDKSINENTYFLSYMAKVHCDACNKRLTRGKNWIHIYKSWMVRYEKAKEDYAKFGNNYWACSEKCQTQIILREK